MKLDPPEQRKARQMEAKVIVSHKTNITPSNVAWHHPKNAIDTEDDRFHNRIGPLWWFRLSLLFTRLFRNTTVVVTQYHDYNSLFSRCYCCLDRLPKAHNLDPPSRPNFQYREWTALRRKFLNLPLQTHLLDESETPDPTPLSTNGHYANDMLPLNGLCVKCDALCGCSTLLVLMGGTSLRKLGRFFRHDLSPFPLTDELFEHWSTFPQLLDESSKGCHLCSLILDTLSEEQQDDLCRRDTRLEPELIELEDNTESRRRAIKVGRTVYIKILTPIVSTLGWRHDENRKYTASSLLLMPHFGYSRVPRRWIRQRNVERSHSLNKDPGMNWHLEQVDPIEIWKTSE